MLSNHGNIITLGSIDILVALAGKIDVNTQFGALLDNKNNKSYIVENIIVTTLYHIELTEIVNEMIGARFFLKWILQEL